MNVEMFKEMKLGEVPVPDGVSGPWEISSFSITEAQAAQYNVRHLRGKLQHHMVQPGDYKRLVCINEDGGRDVVMSNTPMEVTTNAAAAIAATGRVLINGLGLGMLLHHLLQKPEVTEVIVVERSADVIKLVAPSYLDNPKVTIAWGDAFTYEPTGLFDFVWHDIWTFISDGNLEEMDRLEAKYAPIAKVQMSWAREECVTMAREMDAMLARLKRLREQP